MSSFWPLLAPQALSPNSHHGSPMSHGASSGGRSFAGKSRGLVARGGSRCTLSWPGCRDRGRNPRNFCPFSGRARGETPPLGPPVLLPSFPPLVRLEGAQHWTVKIRHLDSVDPHFKSFCLHLNSMASKQEIATYSSLWPRGGLNSKGQRD